MCVFLNHLHILYLVGLTSVIHGSDFTAMGLSAFTPKLTKSKRSCVTVVSSFLDILEMTPLEMKLFQSIKQLLHDIE